MENIMVYITTVNSNTYRVETPENGQHTSVTLDDNSYGIDWHQIAPLAEIGDQASAGGHFSLLIGGRSYDVFARLISKPGQREGETYEIHLAGQRFEVKVEDERSRLLAGLIHAGSGSSEATVEAPMPGLVIDVPIEPGANVSQGQTVVVLEAMKMENDLQSPISGTIKDIRVTRGQTVDQGEALVIISAEPPA
jgi:biotin carboxyl carrier protein